MASSWGSSWLDAFGNSWGEVTVDPNAMVGSGTFGFSATGTLTAAVVPDDVPMMGGGGGKKHNRKRILKKTIYGTVISVWQENNHERPPVVVAEEITEQVAETYRDIEAEIAEVEMRTLIVRLMARAVEEEDDEAAFFAMM